MSIIEHNALESAQAYYNGHGPKERFLCEECGEENDSDDGEEVCDKCKREKINDFE